MGSGSGSGVGGVARRTRRSRRSRSSRSRSNRNSRGSRSSRSSSSSRSSRSSRSNRASIVVVEGGRISGASFCIASPGHIYKDLPEGRFLYGPMTFI